MGILAQRIGKNYDRKQWVKDFDVQAPRLIGMEQQQMDYQQKKQLELWERTSYGPQVEQMQKAGINPALLYGQSGGGGMTIGGGMPRAPQISGTSTGTGNNAVTGMNILTAAQVRLMNAQSKNLEVDAAKKEGVDTENVKADTLLKLANTGNIKADTELKKIETNIAKVDEWIKNNSKEDVVEQIMWASEKTMNEMNNLWREGLLSAAQFQDKVDMLKAELANKLINTQLQKAQTTNVKQETENKKAEKTLTESTTRLVTAERLQKWRGLSIEERKSEISKTLTEAGIAVQEQGQILNSISEIIEMTGRKK